MSNEGRQAMTTTRDVFIKARELEFTMPICKGSWGQLNWDEQTKMVRWFKAAGFKLDPHGEMDYNWLKDLLIGQVAISVVARDLGQAVCAEGAVAVVAWDLSDGSMTDAVNLYVGALNDYQFEWGMKMYGDHDEYDRAFARMEVLAHQLPEGNEK